MPIDLLVLRFVLSRQRQHPPACATLNASSWHKWRGVGKQSSSRTGARAITRAPARNSKYRRAMATVDRGKGLERLAETKSRQRCGRRARRDATALARRAALQ
jgi:hypothetical protein